VLWVFVTVNFAPVSFELKWIEVFVCKDKGPVKIVDFPFARAINKITWSVKCSSKHPPCSIDFINSSEASSPTFPAVLFSPRELAPNIHPVVVSAQINTPKLYPTVFCLFSTTVSNKYSILLFSAKCSCNFSEIILFISSATFFSPPLIYARDQIFLMSPRSTIVIGLNDSFNGEDVNFTTPPPFG